MLGFTNVLAFSNNFRIEYEQLFEVYNDVMVLIKNMTMTPKGD